MWRRFRMCVCVAQAGGPPRYAIKAHLVDGQQTGARAAIRRVGGTRSCDRRKKGGTTKSKRRERERQVALSSHVVSPQAGANPAMVR